jgi:dihydrofolate reductase
MKPLALIAAMTPDGIIAEEGKIPWHVRADMLRFKRLTTGHAIVMGRKTYESIGKPLPNRRNIVVSRRPHVASLQGLVEPAVAVGPGLLEWWTSFDRALEAAYRTDESPFIIGGGEIYKLALPFATTLEITYIARSEERAKRDRHKHVYSSEKVTRFPIIRPDPWDWRCVCAEPAVESTKNEDGSETLAEVEGVEFLTFERRGRGS